MKAQTYLDVTRGIRLIDRQITSALFGNDEQKASFADAAGALALLGQIEQVTETLRQVITHDTGKAVEVRLIA